MTSSKVEKFENDSYDQTCERIRSYGIQRFGQSGYSRIVFTNGCFDILHKGHLKILSECRSLAGPKGAVVVGVNSDQSVTRIKGPERPILDEDTRCSVLVHLKNVDHVVIFSEDTPQNLIISLRPDIVVKGSDYAGKKIVGADIAHVHLVDVVEGQSTTSIVKSIVDKLKGR